MNHTIGQSLHAHLQDEDHEHCPDYVAVTEIATNSTINASINKAPFEVLYGENTPLSVDLLLYRKSCINPYAHSFARNMKQAVNKVKSAMHDA